MSRDNIQTESEEPGEVVLDSLEGEDVVHRDDSQILPDSGDSVPPTSHHFLLPCSVPRPAPQTSTNNSQDSELGHVNLAADAHDVDSLEQEADDPFVNTRSQSRKGRKTTEFWEVKIIADKNKHEEAMERPNGRKVVHRFNSAKQAIRDKAGLLSGVLGLLGSNYGKFPICKESWHKITTKDKVYNECVKQIFHFDEDSEGTIKKNILKSMGKSWKEGRLSNIRRKLIESIRDGSLSIAPKLRRRYSNISSIHHNTIYLASSLFKSVSNRPLSSMDQQKKCRKNAINRSKQLYTHTGRSKNFARRMEEEVLNSLLNYFYNLRYLGCVEYGDGLNFANTFGTTREKSR
ncbi:hypothetical protein Ahy_A05g025391 [Arachis hypogaea]|uniref:Uncharacterized protein n=1 Tax=Arachis hypogaea TaxID=3818 RepID=A0A445D8K2_ARAHY|nr:hypothetical protein Ahy_A05g025391 [Arachis hypogaea]